MSNKTAQQIADEIFQNAFNSAVNITISEPYELAKTNAIDTCCAILVYCTEAAMQAKFKEVKEILEKK